MRLVVILFAIAGLCGPALAQGVAPVPPPRPASLGGTAATPTTTAEGEFAGPAGTQEPESVSEALEAATAIAAAVLPDTNAPTLPASSLLPEAPQPVRLFARITEGGATIPSGVTWRLYDPVPDERGELVLHEKSDQAVANLMLPPGEYVAHVSYGHAQASDTINVEAGVNERAIILDAGGLRLNALISGDVSIPSNMLTFTVSSLAVNETDEDVQVVRNVRPGQIVNLNSGVYQVESLFGRQNATVRAEITVEPGELVDATLYHRASEITLKLVSEPGGEAIADTEWTVQTLGGDPVFTDVGAFGNLVLAEGEYTVIAKLGGRVFNRDFQVLPGQSHDIEVVTNIQ